MPAVKSEIIGAKELEKALRTLPNKIQDKVLKSALRSGAQVIRKEAKARVPVRSGVLKDSITVKTATEKQRDQGLVFVGFDKTASRRAHLTEYGTSHSAAHPFMRPALDARGSDAIKKIGDRLGPVIDREAKKLKGKR